MSQRIPLHKQFRNKRVQVEMKQSYLAQKADVDQGTVSRFENGKSSPTIEHFLALVTALDPDWELNVPGVQILIKANS